MGGFPILTAMTFLPLVGAALILLVRAATAGSRGAADEGRQNRAILLASLIISAATFVLSVAAFLSFDKAQAGYQLVEHYAWYGPISYKLGVDGLSMTLILLTTFLTPICLLASWNSIDKRVTEYVVAFLVLETFMIGVFTALDLVLFYIFFEAGLIPMFLIIGIWGGKDRIYASYKFFLYTLIGSLLLLVAAIYMISSAGSADFEVLEQYAFDPSVQTWLWLAFLASFAVKLPMWPVHTWLPDAHVQAPTAGSVVLAGVLLKMGGYGMLRFSLPMFPDASAFFQPMMFALAIIAIVYTSLVAWRQTDMKKLIAYSSVAHMGFVTLGIFAFNETGIQGAIFQMLSHGLISGALFLIVGVVYDRMHTRDIAAYGGLVNKMPIYAGFFMLFTMANVGLPGTSGFIGEILTMVGSFQAATWAAVGAALGVIFSAVYMLTLYRRTVFGEVTNPKLADIKDMNRIEWICIAPLAALTILFGVAPNLIFAVTGGATERIIALMAGGQ
ncbi:NADH-quinone oxidoreductase subunit M [Hyphomonas sp. WL0036]|uniref:NADH-quinone oxidoreductase subunit M n=1 Tax=Hyphomonas sediminis TaxID=2866160 RepID=UPI001C80C9A8|nr:NADH-quinone oxidoreductase subunit M [Hyphomonas sediminis]MBY9067562.1 NADH-quinone oxidoreductase subunit M [Hyphomonas sediminis]